MKKTTYSTNVVTTHMWHRPLSGSAALAYAAAVLLLWSCITVVLMAVDTRLFQGVSVWSKPWKFQISTSVFLWTLAYFMAFLPEAKRRGAAAQYIVWGSLVATAFEIPYITWQAALAQASHFNVSSTLYGLLYNAMAAGALALTSAALLVGVLIFKHCKQTLTNAMRHAIAWGLISSFVLGSFTGMYVGSKRLTGHWVGGIASDAGGWLFFNWSRTGGDLRVAHFFSLHAMQGLPVIALLLARSQMTDTAQTRWVWLATVAYAAWCVWTFVQAVQGVPFM